jgi:hypothetical protein
VTEAHWEIDIHEHGRSGIIDYREGDHRASVEWELGGGEVVAIVTSVSTKAWSRMFPWAAGRQREILERIGAELIARKAPGCVVDFDARTPEVFYLRRPASA